ncbi:DUF5132 domain-containing protein [Kamptonema formosum]|uniref:DUF5132 domain-containing protein n=1 Tax=Kamptonema formosum TaxID=331992 RepID=UPI000348A169|nr:DUF5132 domain-containing protein [Oscillatoria sp. PCC 10802]
MALKIGNFFEEFGPVGIAAGIGAVVLLPVAAGFGKPIAKAAIKGGIALYEKSKGVFAEAGEVFEDLVAEARAEIAEEQTKAQMDVAVNPPEG